MRTSVIHVQHSTKLKRKSAVTLQSNKILCTEISRHNKENIDPSSHADTNNNDVDATKNLAFKNCLNKSTPCYDSKKVFGLTKGFIKVICNTVQKSAAFILGPRIYLDSRLEDKFLVHNSNHAESHSDFAPTEVPENELSETEIPKPLNSFSKLPLDENFCLIKKIENCDFEYRNYFTSLSRYLKQRNTILRRSKTEALETHSICSAADIYKFLWLIEEDPMISLFLKRDVCRRYADKYLLAMVMIYFTRTRMTPVEFTREKFFAALYLAHDMEEDNEELKYEIFPYCLGTKWKKYYPYLLSLRDDLFWALDCRAVVSRKCCEQVMNFIPDHWIWQRERPEYHADIVREYTVTKDLSQPRGPYKNPVWCRTCLERECVESDNSYIVYSSPSEFSSSESPVSENKEKCKKPLQKDSGFESFLNCPNDQTETKDGQTGGCRETHDAQTREDENKDENEIAKESDTESECTSECDYDCDYYCSDG